MFRRKTYCLTINNSQRSRPNFAVVASKDNALRLIKISLSEAIIVNYDFLLQRLRYLQIKTIGIPVLQRLIEWPLILEWLSPRRGDRILDVACGSGQLTFRISTYGCDAHGIDVSSNMIYGQRLANFWGVECAFVKGTAERLPYADVCFDRVVCSSSLEHFKDDIGALQEMNRGSHTERYSGLDC